MNQCNWDKRQGYAVGQRALRQISEATAFGILCLAGKFSTSAARQGFHQLFRATGRFRDSIARQANLWPGIQLSAGTSDSQAAKQILFMRAQKNRWIYRTSAGSSPLPAAGRMFS
jgi:hypothetical protein